jgi:hypothetical protein
MSHCLPQHAADRSGIRAMAVGGHPVRAKARGGLGRAEEGLSRLHVAVLAQQGVDQVSVPVDRPIKVTPLTPDPQIRLVDILADSRSAPHSVSALAQRLAHDRQQLGLPVTNGLVAHLDCGARIGVIWVYDRMSGDFAPFSVLDGCRAVQIQCRAPLPHPEAAAPGDERGCHLAMPLPNLQGAGLRTRLARRDAPPVPSQAIPLIDQALSIARRPAGMFRSRGSGKILV